MSNLRYTKNEDYWSEPTVENSYWAGIIAADGTITKHNSSASLALRLKLEDIVLVEGLARAVNYNGDVRLYRQAPYTYKAGNKANRQVGYTISESFNPTLSIYNAHTYHKDLLKHYNIGPRKSLTMLPPNSIDEKQQLAYIFGYYMGDGSLMYDKSGNQFNVEILGTEEFLRWITSIIHIYSDMHYSIRNRYEGGIHSLFYRGNRDVQTFLDLFKDLHYLPVLPRKISFENALIYYNNKHETDYTLDYVLNYTRSGRQRKNAKL